MLYRLPTHWVFEQHAESLDKAALACLQKQWAFEKSPEARCSSPPRGVPWGALKKSLLRAAHLFENGESDDCVCASLLVASVSRLRDVLGFA